MRSVAEVAVEAVAPAVGVPGDGESAREVTPCLHGCEGQAALHESWGAAAGVGEPRWLGGFERPTYRARGIVPELPRVVEAPAIGTATRGDPATMLPPGAHLSEYEPTGDGNRPVTARIERGIRAGAG